MKLGITAKALFSYIEHLLFTLCLLIIIFDFLKILKFFANLLRLSIPHMIINSIEFFDNFKLFIVSINIIFLGYTIYKWNIPQLISLRDVDKISKSQIREIHVFSSISIVLSLAGTSLFLDGLFNFLSSKILIDIDSIVWTFIGLFGLALSIEIMIYTADILLDYKEKRARFIGKTSLLLSFSIFVGMGGEEFISFIIFLIFSGRIVKRLLTSRQISKLNEIKDDIEKSIWLNFICFEKSSWTEILNGIFKTSFIILFLNYKFIDFNNNHQKVFTLLLLFLIFVFYISIATKHYAEKKLPSLITLMTMTFLLVYIWFYPEANPLTPFLINKFSLLDLSPNLIQGISNLIPKMFIGLYLIGGVMHFISSFEILYINSYEQYRNLELLITVVLMIPGEAIFLLVDFMYFNIFALQVYYFKLIVSILLLSFCAGLSLTAEFLVKKAGLDLVAHQYKHLNTLTDKEKLQYYDSLFFKYEKTRTYDFRHVIVIMFIIVFFVYADLSLSNQLKIDYLSTNFWIILISAIFFVMPPSYIVRKRL